MLTDNSGLWASSTSLSASAGWYFKLGDLGDRDPVASGESSARAGGAPRRWLHRWNGRRGWPPCRGAIPHHDHDDDRSISLHAPSLALGRPPPKQPVYVEDGGRSSEHDRDEVEVSMPLSASRGGAKAAAVGPLPMSSRRRWSSWRAGSIVSMCWASVRGASPRIRGCLLTGLGVCWRVDRRSMVVGVRDQSRTFPRPDTIGTAAR